MLLKSHRLRPAAPEEGDFCVWELIWNGALDLFATKTALKQPSVLVSLSLHSELQTNRSITLLEGIVVTTTAQCLTSNVNLKGFFFCFFFANSGPFLPNKPNYYCSDGFHLRSWSKAILNKTIRAFSLPHNSVQNSNILRFLLLRFLTFPLTFPLFLARDGWRNVQESGGGGRRGKMEGVDVLLSSAECAHMYERRRIYFRTLAWVSADLNAHTHTEGKWSSQTRRWAWPTFVSILFWKLLVLRVSLSAAQHNIPGNGSQTQAGETIKSGQKRWHKKNNNAAKTVAMVIRSPTCSYVKRDLYWADTVSSTALCQEYVCVCACVYSRRRQTK